MTRPGVNLDKSDKLSERNYLSWSHMWTAAHHAAVCERREAEMVNDGEVFQMLHRSSAITTVMSAVAFLESLVNELFQDAADIGKVRKPMFRRSQIIDPRSVDLLGRFWTSKGGERNLAVLDKYQMSLLLCGAEKLDEGRNPYQDANNLVRLRNDLVHFKPATTLYKEGQDLERKLASRFPSNRAISKEAQLVWFPSHCLGSGCAAWARDTAIALADDWSERLGLSKYHREALSASSA
jgi:hypothetical protein